MRNRFCALLAVLLLAPAQSAPVRAQAQAPSVIATERGYSPVPFGPGEKMTYKLTLGLVGDVGKGSIEVEDIDTIHGHEAYQLRLYIKGGVPLATVEDEYQSWLDMDQLISRRFKTDVHEVRYKRKRTFEFFPAEKMWRRSDKPSEYGPMPTAEPLDDLSFLYFVRTLPLELGKTYTLARYWRDEGNPVTLKVVRRELVTVGAGQFRTIVVQPIIRTKGLFAEGGKAEIYFTDDDRRIPVMIKTGLSVPLLKSLNMYLQTYSPGKRVAPPFTVRGASN